MKKIEKYKLESCVILIVIKIDSEENLKNAALVLDHLLNNFEVKISILEVGKHPFFNSYQGVNNAINYEFMKESSEIFHITRYRNILIRKTQSNIVIHHNPDIIVEPESLLRIVQNIKNGTIDIGYPFDGRQYRIPALFKRIYQQVKSFDFLKKYHECFPLSKVNSLESVFVAKRSFYEQIGFENEKIICLGLDDKDRFFKSIIAGARYMRSATPLYHLNQTPHHDHISINNIGCKKEYINNLYKI